MQPSESCVEKPKQIGRKVTNDPDHLSGHNRVLSELRQLQTRVDASALSLARGFIGQLPVDALVLTRRLFVSVNNGGKDASSAAQAAASPAKTRTSPYFRQVYS